MVSILEVTRRIDYTVLAVFCVVLAGFLLGMFPVNTGYHYWDETVYLQHGEIIAGESPNNFNEFRIRPPLFSLMLGAVFMLSHSLISAHVFVAGFSALGILLTYWLGRDFFDAGVGVGAAFVYAISPLRIKMAGDIMVDALLPVLWLMTFFLFYRAIQSSEGRFRNLLYFSTGVSAGLAVLMKFTSLVMLPILGVSLLVFNRFEGFTKPRKLFQELFEDMNNYLAVAGFVFMIFPYLLWSKITYGGFFSTFIYAWSERGLTDPVMTYLISLDVLMPAIFYAGILIYIMRADITERFEDVFLLLVPGIFYLVMQFLIRNKEPRFLLPAIPFAAIAASAGIREVFSDKRFYIFLLVSALVFAPMISGKAGESILNHGTTYSASYYPEGRAGIWMRGNTSKDAVLYTNFHEPILGYYSKREIIQLPNYQSFEKMLKTHFNQSGYVYYANSTRFRNPSYREMVSRPGFSKVKSFGGRSHLFYYEGEHSGE
ncbi:MAG: ArnT family glycosyltransferase [Candidatus Nanohalobium sp.]